MKSKKQETPVKNRRLDGYGSLLNGYYPIYTCMFECGRTPCKTQVELILITSERYTSINKQNPRLYSFTNEIP